MSSSALDLDAFLTDENLVRAIFDGWQEEANSAAQVAQLSHHTSEAYGLAMNVSNDVPAFDQAFLPLSFSTSDNPPKKKENTLAKEGLDSVSVDTSIYNSLPPNLDMSSALHMVQKLDGTAEGEFSGASADIIESVGNLDPLLQKSLGRHTANYITATMITLEQACEIPENPLREELITAYFKHVHPLCPVVDEFEFYDMYDNRISDAVLKQDDELPLFQAMMFAAMAHVPDSVLQDTPFKSIYEAQKSYFDKVLTLYRKRITSDNLILTKMCLLLTYWSPYNAEFQVNSYWVDRSFYHARAIRLWDPQQYSGALCCRRRIVWWCCLLRDRLISFGLRRFHRLQEVEQSFGMVEEADFGLELAFPRHIDIHSKRDSIACFVKLCELSDVVKEIAVFHENLRFEREWSDSFATREAIVPELAKVAHLENQLREWKQTFQTCFSTSQPPISAGSSILPLYTVMICDSALAALYLPYIHSPSTRSSLAERFQKVALRRIKGSASSVADLVRTLESTANVEDIPMPILAWTILPMTACKVLSENKERDVTTAAYRAAFESFKALLSRLAARFRGAEYILQLMKEDTESIVKKSRQMGWGKTLRPGQTGEHGASDGPSLPGTDEIREAEYLACVARMVDLRLANEVH